LENGNKLREFAVKRFCGSGAKRLFGSETSATGQSNAMTHNEQKHDWA